MNTLQQTIDAMTERASVARVACGQNMSLGELIQALAECPNQGAPARIDGQKAVSLGSYRGYYRDLAIQAGDRGGGGEVCLDTVEKLRQALQDAVGATFEGYKGGDYVMDKNTPMWSADYGCEGPAIHATKFENGVFAIATVPEEF